jgi:hypothetical protein
MRTSESLVNIAPAAVKATATLRAISKDSVNPHFKSKFASLDAIMAEVRPVLAKQGLTVLQGVSHPHSDNDGRVTAFSIETILLHESGEWISSSVFMPVAKVDPQGAGAAVSYGRRYGISALLAIVSDEDDDGNSAMPSPQQRAQAIVQQSAPAPRPAPARPAATGNAPAAVADIARQVVDAAIAKHNAAADGEPSCPKCNGRMWDNRVGKKNPKSPDFRCRDKQCDGLYWPGTWPPAGAPVADEHEAFDMASYAPDDDGLPF